MINSKLKTLLERVNNENDSKESVEVISEKKLSVIKGGVANTDPTDPGCNKCYGCYGGFTAETFN